MCNIHILFLLLIFLTSTQAAPVYLYHICTNTTTYTPNTTFKSNLNTLFSNLSSSATQNKGFSNSTIGRGSQNIAYGLYLCRGDVSPDVCRECVTTAAKQIVENCPKEKKAIIWYDECMVRYSDKSFFSTVDERTRVFMWNRQNITEPTRFKKLLEDTMNDLANKTTKQNSSYQLVKMFETESVKFTNIQNLFGLVQCTLDLSMADCNRCLRIAISNLSNPDFRMDDKQGGRVLMQSCNVRFELYKFYREPNISPSPSPSPSLPPSPLPAIVPPTKSKGDGGGSVKLVFIIVPVCVFVVILVIGFCYLNRKQRKNVEAWTENTDADEISTIESLQFDLSTVQAATNNFSADNKIGEGGFGEVFKGVLKNGQEIAVKRLSKGSGQGAQEFKNEVVVVAKLQHRSLARLIGFCLQDEEKILIYQYFPNKSLDNILFDPQRQKLLDWSRRYKIIGGIARGMLYLHEDSRLKIIHRDLKASNILLDEDMNPKISDFGMARIFGVDQSQANTSRIVGTYGYMSPEYAMHGHFSVKSDVFSFGVLVLEIVSGKKNSNFFESDRAEDLLSYAWKQWNNNTPLELLDPTIENLSYSRDEVIRCINIGLLCVQEDVEARPTMASVVTMLTSYSVTMSLPQQPPFFAGSYTIGDKSTTTTSSPIPYSVDESSITGVYPR